MRFFIFIKTLIIITTLSSAAQAEFWPLLSRQLTLNSNSTPRTEVIKKLKRVKDLDAKLKKAFDSEMKRPYALDVISALKLTHFVDFLMEKIPEDTNGHTITTLNTLVDKDTLPKISGHYKNLVENSLSSLKPVTTVVLIDTLNRWNIELKKEVLPTLLEHSFYEVRISTIGHIENMVLKNKSKEHLKMAEGLIKLSPFQARIRALEFYDRLPGGKIRVNLLKSCLDDKNTEVRLICEKLKNQWLKK